MNKIPRLLALFAILFFISCGEVEKPEPTPTIVGTFDQLTYPGSLTFIFNSDMSGDMLLDGESMFGEPMTYTYIDGFLHLKTALGSGTGFQVSNLVQFGFTATFDPGNIHEFKRN